MEGWAPESRLFKFSLENGYSYLLRYYNLLNPRFDVFTKKEVCDFMVQGHHGKYLENYEQNGIILGRPIFENFYLFFDYDKLQLYIGDGPKYINGTVRTYRD